MGKSYRGAYGSKYHKPHLKNRRKEQQKIEKALKKIEKKEEFDVSDFDSKYNLNSSKEQPIISEVFDFLE